MDVSLTPLALWLHLTLVPWQHLNVTVGMLQLVTSQGLVQGMTQELWVCGVAVVQSALVSFVSLAL